MLRPCLRSFELRGLAVAWFPGCPHATTTTNNNNNNNNNDNANDMLWEANTLDKRSRPEAGSRRGSRSQDDVHAVWVLWLQTNGVSTDGAAAKVMNLTD